MSVGGKVIETIVLADRVWVNTKESAKHGGTECAVFVERTDMSRSISEGDTLWWQGGSAYWPPKSRAFSEKPLLRIGCSGVIRPAEGGAQ